MVVVLVLAVAALGAFPTAAQQPGQPPAAEPRELIYCADLMTPEERETYRASMRAARNPEARAALRQAHRDRMHARARERGIDVMQCEPQHQRQRLRLRGGAP